MTAHNDTTIGDCRIIHADCLDVLPTLEAESVDSVVTDPPYHLTTGKRGGSGDASVNLNSPYGRSRITTGFMGQKWDGGDIAHRADFWQLVINALKPGGHMLVFGGTRTYHRMAAAVEDAGFEVRDQLQWITGSGFPKNHRMGRYSDEWDGWGTALKPANEPILLARKPLSERNVAANVLKHGTGAINVDGARIPFESTRNPATNPLYRKQAGYKNQNAADTGSNTWQVKDGTGERTAEEQGRYPANVIHDGSDEVLEAFAAYGERDTSRPTGKPAGHRTGGFGDVGHDKGDPVPNGPVYGDTGTAARFFYSAKAGKSDRAGSRHPTVKPVDLMAYLTRLITPPGGLVLDPFAGTGTAGMGALREGFRAVLIEREAEYVADIHRRLRHISGEDTPLFQAQQIDLEDLA